MPAGIASRLTFDRHRLFAEDRRGVEQRAVMLAAVEAVAEADAVGLAGGDDADLAAEAAAGEAVHACVSSSELSSIFSKRLYGADGDSNPHFAGRTRDCTDLR